MFTRFEVQKTHYFPHTVHYCCSSMPRLSETRWFLQRSSFWEARRALIGQLSSALWLAEYLKRVTEMLRPFTCCDAVSRRDDTKTIKLAINEAFVAFSEDIMTDYNDSYGLFSVALRRARKQHHVCICDRRNAKQALLYTAQNCVWIVSSKFFKYRNVLTGSESEAPDCPCDVGIAPLYSVHSHS